MSAPQEPCLVDKIIEDSLPLNQSSGRVKLDNLTLIKHDNAVRVHDCADTMRNCDDGPIMENVLA